MTAALAEAGPGSIPEPEAVGSSPPSVEARALRATLACIARHGVAKTSIDDVAREAGCSRATLYRYFGGRRQLIEATVRAELDRIVALVHSAAARAETLEDAVVAILGTAETELAEQPALRFVADFEPERLLPHLAFAAGDRFLARASAVIEPCLARFLARDASRAAEWVARVGLALWLSPTAPVSLGDDEAMRPYVRAFVIPAIDPSVSVLSKE